MADLAAEQKKIEAHTLTGAEWDLLRGLRLRRDGNLPEAAKAFNAALMQGGNAREWLLPVASQLYRDAVK